MFIREGVYSSCPLISSTNTFSVAYRKGKVGKNERLKLSSDTLYLTRAVILHRGVCNLPNCDL